MILPYAKSIYPPVPVLDVFFSVPTLNDWQGPFTAIIDSGADFTIVPLSILEPIQPPIVKPVVLRSHWQDTISVYMYEIDLRVEDIVLPAVDIAGDPGSSEVLLGRNVLNQMDIRLEGPSLRTHLLKK